jgi:hypothetical protein
VYIPRARPEISANGVVIQKGGPILTDYQIKKAVLLAIEAAIKKCDADELEGVPINERKIDYSRIISESIEQAKLESDFSNPLDGITIPRGYA